MARSGGDNSEPHGRVAQDRSTARRSSSWVERAPEPAALGEQNVHDAGRRVPVDGDARTVMITGGRVVRRPTLTAWESRMPTPSWLGAPGNVLAGERRRVGRPTRQARVAAAGLVSGFVSATPTSHRLRRPTGADEQGGDTDPDQVLWPTGTTQRLQAHTGEMASSLITRRSLVQIQPPPLREGPGQRPGPSALAGSRHRRRLPAARQRCR
jgi:hypothetical protein